MRKTDLTFANVLIVMLLQGAWGAASVQSEPLFLSRDGKTDYVIVESEHATNPEQFAARELAEFLGHVTGAEFAIVKESAATNGNPRIALGWTDVAVGEGIDPTLLGQEEWIIRTVGRDLLITGGRPRGTLYGVYEFLEDYVGCHWLDEKTEVIPATPTLTLPRLDVRDKPFFWRRRLGSGLGLSDGKWEFMVRNKYFKLRRRPADGFYPDGAFCKQYGSPGSVHTFSKLVNARDWFDTHPEYFSLVRGERLPAHDSGGPGQLCLTNPDLLRLMIANLRRYIAQDRLEAAGRGCPPPKAYWISQNDQYASHCSCPTCQVIAKREEGESGPLIAFVNAVAEALEEDYPDILIGTIAYNQTATPPKHIRPRHNVLIGWCDVYSKVDGIRPLQHPLNSENYGEITSWAKAAPRLAIGDDYWTGLSYYKYFPTPYAIIDCIAADLKLYADLGVESFFAESPDYNSAGQQFVPLKYWIAYQLMVDPYQPKEPLVETFMDGYFGAASDTMHAYLNYLRKRIDADAQFKMLRDAPHKLAYLDLNFFEISQEMFDQAEALVEPESPEADHISDERFTLDGALLYLWPWVERKLPEAAPMPFDHEAVIQRFAEEWKGFGRFSKVYSHYQNCLNEDGKLLERMTGLFRDPELPDRFSDRPARDIADFNWLTFSNYRPGRQAFVPDEDAVGGMAATFAEKDRIQKAEKGGAGGDLSEVEQHRKPLTFGVTGGPTITLEPEEIPQDGAYRLHRIGRIQVKPDTLVWALEGKRLGVVVDRIYDPEAVDPAANDWNAYISLKVQGPAYVKGSTKPNGVWMDRVLLVKPLPGEEVSDAYNARLEQARTEAAARSESAVPRLPAGAAGEVSEVDWNQAADGGKWWTLNGEHTDRRIAAHFVHDGDWLYLRLSEQMDTDQLTSASTVWLGDDWEMLVAPQRGVKPYRQIAVNPEGAFEEHAYGEAAWDSGVRIQSDVADDAWTLEMAFPLERLIPGGAESGDTLYVNLLRGGKDYLVWSPTFGDKFHTLERFGEWVLE